MLFRRALVTFFVSSSSLLLAGCASSSKSSGPSTDTATYTVQTPSVTVSAGSERYVCYAKTLDEDLAVDRFDYAVRDYVHHMFFSRTTAPEPDGLSECDVVFKTTWIPLFLAGKGGESLQYPAGDANVLPKGTQIVLQMHLLNATPKDETIDVALALHRSSVPNPTPVALYAFGSQNISLPPSATSSVTSECTPAQDVNSFAMFAHEHQLGTKLTLEAMNAAGQYEMVYQRSPFDFNNQVIEQIPLSIAKGTKTRITCSYDNTTTGTVGYGESSHDEMCYLAMFVPGQTGAFGCVSTGGSGDAGAAADGGDAGMCTAKPNGMGIGAPCTAGKSDCPSGLSCSSDLNSTSGAGFCLKVGCTGSSDCGGATCCAPSQGGGAVNVCLPTACVPSDCKVK
jgi:hypothetical protein